MPRWKARYRRAPRRWTSGTVTMAAGCSRSTRSTAPHASFRAGRRRRTTISPPKSHDGVMFIGQHAKAGAKDAVWAHSQSFNVRRITLNGMEVGELGQIAAIAGQFGIPVIM